MRLNNIIDERLKVRSFCQYLSWAYQYMRNARLHLKLATDCDSRSRRGAQHIRITGGCACSSWDYRVLMLTCCARRMASAVLLCTPAS